MSQFYTSVNKLGNEILYRGIDSDDDDKRFKSKFQPTLYTRTNTDTGYTAINGGSVEPKEFESMRSAQDFIRTYQDMPGMNIFGMERFVYQFLNEQTYNLKYDLDKIKIASLDIETMCENGFPEPSIAPEEVLLITYKMQGTYYVFGTGNYTRKEFKGCPVVYYDARNEQELFEKWLTEWNRNTPHVVTGWNVNQFDMTYLYNRICKVLSADCAKSISPWGYVSWFTKYNEKFGESITVPNFYGLPVLDYLELYKKFTYSSRESYKLDYIAHYELKTGKISGFTSLNDLYKTDWKKFVDYNLQDCNLVQMLEDKMQLLNLVMVSAYEAKINFQDVLSQLKTWDAIIYNYLKAKKIIVPVKPKYAPEAEGFEGGYVKAPQTGMHNWVVSYDLNSLYPSLIRQYGIGPEKLVDNRELEFRQSAFKEPEKIEACKRLRKLAPHEHTVDKMVVADLDETICSSLRTLGLTMTPNGALFDNCQAGFLSNIMQTLYEERVEYKNIMIKEKQAAQKTTGEDKEIHEKEAKKADIIQKAKKIQLNSAYGALGNRYFRFYDIRLAEGITKSGQLSIRWIERKINEFLNKVLKTKDEDFIIAVDTDSVYLNMEKFVNKFKKPDWTNEQILAFIDKVCEGKLQDFITSSYEDLQKYVNAPEQQMIMKRECLADKGLWTAKKRYILNVLDEEGVAYKEPKLKIMGIETVKSSTPGACRDNLKKVITLIMQKDENSVIAFINNFRKEFKTLPLEDIAFPRGCNNLDKYKDNITVFKKGCPIHIRGSLIHNKLLRDNKILRKYAEIRGDKVKYIYLELPNVAKSDVIAWSAGVGMPSEFRLDKNIDYEKQFDKAFLSPLKNILDIIGWQIDKPAMASLFE